MPLNRYLLAGLIIHYTHFTDNLREKFYASRNTALADCLFTLPAVIIQPLTGFWLIYEVGYGWIALWLMLTYGIYIIVGACRLPMVWIQIQLKKMIADSLKTGADLPGRYHRLFKIWFILGWPVFVGLLMVFFLMMVKPV